MGYTSQTSFDASNNSFDVSNPTASLLDPNAYGPSSSSASISTTYSPGYGQNNPTYNQSAINLQTINYSPVNASSYKTASGGGGGGGGSSASSSSNYPNAGFTQSATNLDPLYDSFDARRIDEQLKQLDEALLSKVSEMTMLNSSIQSNKLQLKQMNANSLNRQMMKGQSSIDITVGSNNNNSSSTSTSSSSSNATKINANSLKKGKIMSSSCKNVSVEETFY